jgi:hypothetical protein
MNNPGYPQPPQGQYQQQPQKSGGGLKTVLIVLCVLLVLGFGACVGTCMYVKSAATDMVQSMQDGGMVLTSPEEVQTALAGPKKDYVGDWTSPAGSTLSISSNGQFNFEQKETGKKRNISAPIGAFEGDNIVVKLIAKITYVVTPPKKVGSEYVIVVDGVKLTRAAD